MRYIKNLLKNSADMYVYGDISNDKDEDWFSSANTIDPFVVKQELEELKTAGVTELNIYINSPGGSVFGASTIVSLLKRFRTENGATLRSYVDGLCASAATYLLMAADEVNIYQNSIVMIHKPMTVSFGNVHDLQKDIDTLNTIEEDMMLPLYMAKAVEGVSSEEMAELVDNETWLTGNPNDDYYIGKYFTVNCLDEVKDVAASLDLKLLNMYKSVPLSLIRKDRQQNIVENQKVDYSPFDKIIEKFMEVKK